MLAQPPLRVERGLRAQARRGDRLPVDPVSHLGTGDRGGPAVSYPKFMYLIDV